MAGQRILFAVHDWGLGHATRALPLIRGLLEAGHAVTVLSTGPALRLLECELAGRCAFHDLPGIPKPFSRTAAGFYARLTLSLPRVLRAYRRERRFTRELCRQQGIDRIVSDTRFGVVDPEVPSYFLTQSLRQIVPGRPRLLERAVEAHQRRLLAPFRRILVPDRAEDGGLTGDLSHHLSCDWGGRLTYIGPITDLAPREGAPELDCFVTLSGEEPQRTMLAQRVLGQVEGLPGRVVVTLGRQEATERTLEGGRVTVYGHLDREVQGAMMNRARLVVCRSGLSTLSEVARLGKRALLIPTPGQSEQEYLARYHRERGHAHAVSQSRLDLARDAVRAEGYPGLPPVPPGEETVRRFLAAVEA
ncbi:glycosyltransferase [Thiohalorhabdus denitrificans]|uniref:UDP:flavonoid glycosyltransferase YjiC, YdhE family n=1 Tax=Thiohalorhabdus denitrificans TaxID=381306 RepID=A0A1G5E4X1_9GAMM|nr:glycosyltransferase [Thiohalorhabdus denitrificans]SCY22026.1 UDP:flavonoid glycosyltransferase YjiC, YdhE family [Thiohalorhabdus denitrificans]